MIVIGLAQRERANLGADAAVVRGHILRALYAAGGGHYGGSLSVVDILVSLYRDVVPLTGGDARDRVILSKGHAAIALYAVLAHFGYLPVSSLERYGRADAGLEGHPDMLETAGIEFSTGSLGQGISVGLGMALALRRRGAHVWVVVGDGECQEGQTWEAAMLAARYNLDTLHVVVDANGAQEVGWAYDARIAQAPVDNVSAKWRAFGWDVQTIPGHDHVVLRHAMLSARRTTTKPSVIIARTKKGKGVSWMESSSTKYHCTELTHDQHRSALREIDAAVSGTLRAGA